MGGPCCACLAATIISAVFAQAEAHAQTPTGETCVQAQVGAEQAYSCLNDHLARLAGSAHAAHAAVLSAQSPAPATGTFSYAATAERMGNAFGHSVTAQRPPPPFFAVPFIAPAR